MIKATAIPIQLLFDVDILTVGNGLPVFFFKQTNSFEVELYYKLQQNTNKSRLYFSQ